MTRDKTMDKLIELCKFATSFESAVTDLIMLEEFGDYDERLSDKKFAKKVTHLENWLHDMS